MKRTALILAALLSFAACNRGPALVILHTNDTHSHFEPVRGGEENGMGGVIERAAFVDSVRNACGADNVLLLHAGDFNQGSSYYSELGGSVEVAVVNALGYDCVTLGNHELDNGLEDLFERIKLLECPVVCANLDFSPFGMDEYIKPYVILEKAGRKVGIIGLEAKLDGVVSRTTSDRIQQLDPVEVVNKWAEEIRPECDLVIVLSHQGYEEDHDIAAATRNVDLFVGGHSHTFVDGFDYVKNLDGRKVRIITDGCWGLEMGMVTVR